MILCMVYFLNFSVILLYLRNMISWVSVINFDAHFVLTLSHNGLNSLSAWMIVIVNPAELYCQKLLSRPLKVLLNSLMWCEQLICISLVCQYIPEMHRHLYRQGKLITQFLNCFCISHLEFEYHTLLPALVCSLLAFLCDLVSMVHKLFHHSWYLPLILENFLLCWWIPCAWSSSQLAALHFYIFFWLTWISLFFCL